MQTQTLNHQSRTRVIQPYFVLSTDGPYFKKNIEDSPISHFYSFVVTPEGKKPVWIVPSGSIDILFLCDANSPSAIIYGSTLSAKIIDLEPNRYFGVRFMPGVIPSFINLPASDLVNKSFSFEKLVFKSQDIVEKIAKSADFEQQMAIFWHIFSEKLDSNESELATTLINLISDRKGGVRVKELEEYTNYSSRYIHKVLIQNYGLSPKKLCLIFRFQASLARISRLEISNLTNLAFDLGYTDQSHFLREFKKFSGQTPKEYFLQVQQTEDIVDL